MEAVGVGGGKGSGGRQKNKTKDGLMNIYDVVCVTTMTNKRDSAIHGQRYCLLIWKWPNIIKGGSIKASVIWWYEFQIPGDQGIPHIAAFNMGAGRRRRLTDMKDVKKWRQHDSGEFRWGRRKKLLRACYTKTSVCSKNTIKSLCIVKQVCFLQAKSSDSQFNPA